MSFASGAPPFGQPPPDGVRPPTEVPRRRRSAVAPWIGVTLATVLLLTLTSTVGAPAAPTTTGAAAWLPPDGTRVAFTADGLTDAVEWSRPAAHSLIQLNSPTFATWAGITETDWTQASFVRVTTRRLDAQADAETQAEDLWVIGEDGARTIAESLDGVLDTIWEPGRLDLPATLAAGDSWSSEGQLAVRPPTGEWSVLDYRADYRATAPTDASEEARGCVAVAMTLVINDQELLSDRTWCPGSGLVRTADDEHTWLPTDELPRLPLTAPPMFDWSRAAELEFTALRHSQPGEGMTTLSAISPPGLLPNGLLVVANLIMPDLIAVDTASDPPPVRWAARPGGTLAAAASFGSVTIAATGRRTLIAYGPDGQWLWEAPLSDLTRVPPALAGQDTVVVVSLDGAVTGYDLATGAERWRASMGTEIRLAPLVAHDHIVVADAGGGLSCFDLAGRELWTIDAGRASTLTATPGPEPLVVVGRSDSMTVRAYSLTDGEEVWRQRILEDARQLVSVGDRVVLRDDDRLVALDAATGEPVWTLPQRSEQAVAGDQLLLLTDAAIMLLDRDGRPVREWPHDLGDITRSTHHLVIAGDAVVAWGPTGIAMGRLP